MLLDAPSMLIGWLGVHVLFTLLLLVMWLRPRASDSLALWALANAAGILSTWCYTLREPVPYGVTVSLANALHIASWVLIWNGMRVFSQRKVRYLPSMALPVLVGAVLQFVPFLHAYHPGRVALVGLAWIAVVVSTCLECASAERHERLYVRRFLIAGFWLLACLTLARIAQSLMGQGADEKLLTGRYAGFNLFVSMISGAAWNLALILMWMERLEKRLTENANRDGLTNLLNRRGFQELSVRMLDRARRDRTPVAVLLMDLDHFKTLNDRHGHDTGDRMLRAFARVAERVLRPTDLLARYGGEEFCVLLPNTPESKALVAAERLRQQFELANVNAGAHLVSATVSIGAVEIAGDETLDEALRRADKAMYQAKLKGRNRVEMHARAARSMGFPELPDSHLALGELP